MAAICRWLSVGFDGMNSTFNLMCQVVTCSWAFVAQAGVAKCMPIGFQPCWQADGISLKCRHSVYRFNVDACTFGDHILWAFVVQACLTQRRHMWLELGWHAIEIRVRCGMSPQSAASFSHLVCIQIVQIHTSGLHVQ